MEMHKTGNLEHPTCFPIINTLVSAMLRQWQKNTSKLRSNLISKAKTFLNRITLFNLNSGAAIPRRALNELSAGKDDTSKDTEDTVN